MDSEAELIEGEELIYHFGGICKSRKKGIFHSNIKWNVTRSSDEDNVKSVCGECVWCQEAQ